MNTKSDGISSGLVAVAWVPDDAIAKLRSGEPKIVLTGVPMLKYEGVNTSGIVVLSDAEAIIAQQSERIKELESDVDEEAHIRDRMAKLLAETAVALKGPEKALHRHGWQDLPDVAAKQSAALKLAREALFDMQDSYAAVHGWKDSFVIAATTAIAAIDSLQKGE